MARKPFVFGLMIGAVVGMAVMRCIEPKQTPTPQPARMMIFGPQIGPPILLTPEFDQPRSDVPFYYFNGEKIHILPLRI